MTSLLDFRRLDDDRSGHARYSIIRDDKMGPCAYLHIDAGALEIVPVMQAAPELLSAVKASLAYIEVEAPRSPLANMLRAAIEKAGG
jgi:hypothetical protein